MSVWTTYQLTEVTSMALLLLLQDVDLAMYNVAVIVCLGFEYVTAQISVPMEKMNATAVCF